MRDYVASVNPNWLQQLRNFDLPTHFTRAEGLKIWPAEGPPLWDMTAGFGSAIFGHAPQDLAQVLRTALLEREPNVLVYGVHPIAGTVARSLLDLAEGSLAKVHFCNDGSQAIDTALKFSAITTRRRQFISIVGGFHGLSVGATALAGGGTWREGLPALGPYVRRVRHSDWENLERLLHLGRTAAVVIEIVQGTGIAESWNSSELHRLQALCRSTGTLIVVDEVLTGLGRTGRWFAHHDGGSEFRPDIVTVSKALAAGMLPMAAVLMTEPIYAATLGREGHSKTHGSTFSGYHFGLILANAVVRRLRSERVPTRVAKLGNILEHRLTALSDEHLIHRASGRGLMQAFAAIPKTKAMSMQEAGMRCLNALRSRGWLVMPAAHAHGYLRVMPPLNIEPEHINDFADALEDSLRSALTWR